MRILHVIDTLGSGGAEKLLYDLVPMLNEFENNTVDVLLTTNKDSIYKKKLEELGVRVYTIKYNNMYDPRNVFEIAKLIREKHYNIVHSHLFPTQYWVSLSKIISTNKDTFYITTEHSTHNRRREKKYLRWVEKLIYNRYDRVISISTKTQELLTNWLKPKSIDRFLIIENGIKLDYYQNAVPYEKNEILPFLSNDTKIVAMVARFSEAKDHITVIKAAQELPLNVHMFLIGEGKFMEKYMNLVEDLGLKERVHFLGFREDIGSILKTIDLVLLSSHWEGFGLSIVEGMAAGKPVLVSDIEGLNEIVEDSELRFAPENFLELAEKIKKILNNKDIYEEKKLYSIVRSERYNLDTTVQNINDLYSFLVLNR